MDAYKLLRRLQTRALLFQFYPVLLTTLALCILLICTRGKEWEFFAGLAVVWFFNMILLSTVGRPVERYLMPLVPIMFWALSGVLILVWRALLVPAPPGAPAQDIDLNESRGDA